MKHHRLILLTRNTLVAGVTLFFFGVYVAPAQTFVHPGLLQSRADLERMKLAVAAKMEPIYSGYEVFRTNAESQLAYQMRGPLAMVGRNPTVGQAAYDSDADAAYQCAIQWCITGNRAYADKSKEIINAWSATLKRITGRDAVLMAGLGPFKMVNAAEILRYTDAGWSPAEIRQAETNFREVVYPVIKNFAPFANGNWDGAALKTMMVIGVFCNDRAMFERALRYYEDGAGDGCLTHYVINDTGQCQESGRDQQHTQLGLAHLGDCCEIAWHQGLNLYGYDDNRLLKGFEYTAKYNLGGTVPFVETLDQTGKYHHTRISPKGRGNFRAVWEEIYNAYANRMEIPAPFSRQVVDKIRPEGVGVPSAPRGADHVGFGTLLFARPPENGAAQLQTVPAAPGGVIAQGSPKAIKLTWIASLGAKNYIIKRAAKDDGYKVIARNVPATTYEDTQVQSGALYHYVVTASNAFGESPGSFPVAICAGLPKPWTHQDFGAVSAAGSANFNGRVFTLEGAGAGFGGTNDQFHFAFRPWGGDGTMIARFVPQTSSQFSQFGLMLRATTAADAAGVALLVSPKAGPNVEAPGWRAQLIVRKSPGAAATVRAGSKMFSEPMVTFGRLTGYCWLKLERTGDKFVAAFSSDGKTWIRIGAVRVPLPQPLLAGLAVASRLPGITTTVRFDHVTETNGIGKTDSVAGSRVESPDGKVVVTFQLQAGGVPAYHIEYLGKPIVLESRLGLEPAFTNGLQLVNTTMRRHSGSWTNAFGERRLVPDNYHELTVNLRGAAGQPMRLIFRAYDEGAAFRYSFPGSPAQALHFTGEHTEFHFPANTFSYEEHGTEGRYHRVPVAAIQPQCERPLTLEYAAGFYASLSEADNADYPRLLLSPLPGAPGALVSALGGTTSNTVKPRPPITNNPAALLHGGDLTPWRVFIVGQKPGDLLERDYLIADLNPPCALADTSWIKPGKAMRATELTTANCKAIIDFAATAGLQYVELDSGWYGRDQSYATGDATTVRAPNLDLPEVIRYGQERGVGVILYVDHKQIKKQRDVLFPLYEKWGIAGVKIGFVDVGPQSATAWIAKTIQNAAEHHLVLDIHDGYRPTGLARTWPNLLTVEGIRGNEHMPTPEHNCTLPFTRYIAGPADYTICYYNHRIQTMHAHQLAMAVVAFSPLQFIFWYDQPSDWHGEPEIEFFRHVPTVWDETKVLAGKIGQYAVIARRRSQDWFIGAINDREPRQLKLRLNFLTAGKPYLAHIYSDDPSVPTRTHVRVETRPVNFQTILDARLEAAGGLAIWIAPAPRGMAAEPPGTPPPPRIPRGEQPQRRR